MKVTGFTLTEMIVSMVLSGILASFVYWSYLTVHRYYGRVTKNQETIVRYQQMHYQLRKDIHESKWVLQQESGFQCLRKNGAISYLNLGGNLIRQQGDNMDTLFALCSVQYTLAAVDSAQRKLVKFVSLRCGTTCDTTAVYKKYTPADLFDFNVGGKILE